jgi:hypothetical protein
MALSFTSLRSVSLTPKSLCRIFSLFCTSMNEAPAINSTNTTKPMINGSRWSARVLSPVKEMTAPISTPMSSATMVRDQISTVWLAFCSGDSLCSMLVPSENQANIFTPIHFLEKEKPSERLFAPGRFAFQKRTFRKFQPSGKLSLAKSMVVTTSAMHVPMFNL